MGEWLSRSTVYREDVGSNPTRVANGVSLNWQGAAFGTQRFRVQVPVLQLWIRGSMVESPSDTREVGGSIPPTRTVTVADFMEMHRIVAPDHAGSNPVGHII